MGAQGPQGGRMASPGVACKEDLARQEEIFESRKGELLSRYPDKFILVCGDEVFAGDSDGEVVSRAQAAHPGRPFFLRMHYPEPGDGHDPGDEADDARVAVSPAFEEDISRQREIYEGREDELLARHPGKVIGVCAGDVFAGDDDAEVVSRAEAVHPDRAIFISGREEFCGAW